MPHTDTLATEAAPVARLRWWAELPLILVMYACYSAGRLVVRGDVTGAVDNGLTILDIEKVLFLNAEHPLNRLFTGEPWIGIPADFWYASLHYLVTPAVLVWLFRSHAVHYRAARTWLMTSTFIGLIFFTLLPTAPPRLLDAHHGFVDTMAYYSSWGWWGNEASAPRGLGGMTNQYAAMPSLHVGWALWCGVLLWKYGRTRASRTAAVIYPLVTTLVVMGTGNHYFLDAVAGAAVMGAGLLLAPYVTRCAALVKARSLSPLTRVTKDSPDTRSPVVSAGCQTSTGERIPRQRHTTSRRESGPGATPSESGDSAPAPTR